MEKITLKKLNDWFEHLDERNKIIALLSIDIDIKELNEMDMEELKNEIASGDEKAIEYYNRVYTANGINLFDE